MVSSFAKEIKQSRIIKALPSETIVKRDYWDSYYNHFTLRVKTLAGIDKAFVFPELEYTVEVVKKKYF